MRNRSKLKARNIRLHHIVGSESSVSTTLTTEQCRALLAKMESDPLRIIFIAAVCLGLRAGELRGLKWGDFIEKNCASADIDIPLDLVVGHMRIVPSKGAAYAWLPLSSEMVAVLRNWRSKSVFKCESDWVFASPHHKDATPCSPPVLTMQLRIAARNAGLTGQLGWHTLRCTHSSLLSNLGLSRQTVAAFMGHRFTGSSEQIFVAAQSMIARMLFLKERAKPTTSQEGSS